jgi:uncharacterized protein YegJ (DUF2314 family)
MKAHELARKLLEGPDLDVTTSVACSQETITSDPGEVTVRNIMVGEPEAEVNVVDISGWASDTDFSYNDS